jgi:hypothetical protein
VLVETTPLAMEGAGRFYGGHMAYSERMYDRYDEDQLELLLEFVRGGRELNDTSAAKLEAETRGGPPPSTGTAGGSG